MTANAVDNQPEKVSPGPFTTPCDRLALRRLEEAYSARQPLAVVTGSGRKSLRLIVDNFIAGLGEEADVVRMEEPFADALHCMRFIIRSIDFDPMDLNVKDLENIFMMFLSYQRTHKRRTVICIENAQDFDMWTLDKMRRHIRRESKRKNGLMLVFSGSTELSDLMRQQPLKSAVEFAGQPISLTDCSLSESREYIRRQVEANSEVAVGDLFEFEAATLIHRISGGVRDTIDDICRISLEFATRQGTVPITEALVRQAGMKLGLVPDMPLAETPKIEMLSSFVAPSKRRLIVYIDGRVIHGLELGQGHILIGRDEFCDIRISGSQVAHHHALVINNAEGAQVVDLGGECGTTINGCGVSKQQLVHRDVIEIGKYRIEFLADGDQVDAFSNVGPIEQIASAGVSPADYPVLRVQR